MSEEGTTTDPRPPQLLIIFSPDGAPSVTFTGGVPLMAIIATLECVKARFVQQQLMLSARAEAAEDARRPKVLLPETFLPPFPGA